MPSDLDPRPPTQAPAQRERRYKHRRRRSRWWVAGAAACVIAVAGAGYAVAQVTAAPQAAPQQQQPRPSTAKVEHGTLSGDKTVGGVLDFADSRDLQAPVAGVLTHLPQAGSRIKQGDELFRVDNVPVYLFHGQLPAWRPFEEEMGDGPDVHQLEKALEELGFFPGEPDEHFDAATKQAVVAWQAADGQAQTGRIDLGSVVFAPTDLRVGELKTPVGSTVEPGTALFRVSGLNKQIQADVKLGDQKLARPDVKVQVHLPDGTTAPGRIVSVGQVEEREANGGTNQVIPIVVALDDPEAAEGFQRANVTVDIPSETRDDVLSVPMDALLALPDGEFGVEVVDTDGSTEQVPVKVGLFAGGRVEVSGDGIDEGTDVVVPGR